MFWFKRKKSAIKKLSVSPPTASEDRHGLAVAVCVRDEARYIVEWALYHREVGVRHFLVYDNGSIDETAALLREHLTPDQLTIIPWAGKMFYGPDARLIDGQALAYAHAITSFGAAFRRMAFIDADEFLLPKQGKTIEEALAPTGDFPNVSLPWHMFGTSGHKTKPAGPVVLNYTMRTSDPMSAKDHFTNFKCIVDPCEVIEVSVHQFKTKKFGDITMNDAGQRFSRRGRKSKAFYSSKFLQLNHYYTKSEEEMVAKRLRGSNYIVSSEKLDEKMLATFENLQTDLVLDTTMSDFIKENALDVMLDYNNIERSK